MAKVTPFKAIRPVRDKAHLVASRPYYAYSKNVLQAKLETNPYSFIHIINPEFDKDDRTEANSDERFRNVRTRFESFLKNDTLLQDQKESYYIYRQSNESTSYTGIIAGASVDDYNEGVIKIHEQTLTAREEVFKRYLDICEFNAEPVLLTHEDNPIIRAVVHKYIATRAEFEFTTTDLLKHELWVIEKDEDISTIQNEFENINDIYIADGHHRSSSSALLAQSRKENNPNHTGTETYNAFMAFFIPQKSLDIFDFNRLVKDTNGLSEEELFSKIKEKFTIEKVGLDYKPEHLHEFTMHTDSSNYKLGLKNALENPSAVEKLDANILSVEILEPILGIKDLKTDDRVYFMEGIKGVNSLRNEIELGKAQLAFGLYPVSVEQLKEIADTKSIMPPKSTWIEPKMRSGMTIYKL